jgi:hypothetical protein
MEASPVSPQVFVGYWRGHALKELARAEQAGAQAGPSLPFMRERVRMFEWLSDIRTEQELVSALQRIMRGEGPTLGIENYGAMREAARELLAEWRHPDRDARQTYT